MTIGKELKKALEEDFFAVEPTSNLTTGTMVRILREKNGLSQNQLAKMTALTQPTLSGLENDKVVLGVERAKVLARALKAHPAVLLFPNWEDWAA